MTDASNPEQSSPRDAAGDDARSPAAASEPLSEELSRLGQTVAERYELVALLGVGAMGVVYKARHVHMRKWVALKLLHQELTAVASVRSRFEREAIAAGRISHRNVVAALDFGRIEDGAYYLVLEYVAGETLTAVLDRGRRWPLAQALVVAIQIAAALEAAHAEGVIHRDLKPDNVMVLREGDGELLVKVLDFGIAKLWPGASSEELHAITQTGTVLGTPEYMAPEQATGEGADVRSDLYSLGVVLYRMLAGRPPFHGDTVQATLMLQVSAEPPPLPESLPAPLRAVVSRLLAKAPELRPATAGEVRQVLSACLDGLPLEQRWPVSESPGPSTLGQRLDGSLVGARIPLLGHRIPFWRLAALVSVLAAASWVLWVLLAIAPEPRERMQASSTVVSAQDAGAQPSSLGRHLARALAGDLDAARKLERQDASARGVREWLALARVYSEQQNTAKALVAYERALEGDATLGLDTALQKEVSRATLQPDIASTALRIAARYLGAFGADLIYFVWVRTKAVTPLTLEARQWLHEPAVIAHASPALKFLLQWRSATTCAEYQRLLVGAAISADARAETLLERVAETDCVFEAEAVEAARSAAAGRSPPNLFQ